MPRCIPILTCLMFALPGCNSWNDDPADDDTTPDLSDDDDSQPADDDDAVDDDTTTPGNDDTTDPGDDDTFEPVDCAQISAANAAWEVCETGPDFCNGVFTDGAGCTAYCAAAGLVCTARYGGEPGCQKEPHNVLICNESNGHDSDWCECGLPEGGDDDDSCPGDPYDPPYEIEQDYTHAAYTERHNWVLDCYPYAYTASGDEHEACDNQYDPDGSRTGTATFSIGGVPQGMYDAYMGGRHTANRNPAGALFIVDGVSVVIDQVDPSGDYAWDHHGQYCLQGTVEVVLDSTVNSGSDSVSGVRLVPAN
jgi:hypothetical protein